ncbi:MAG: hypothetical protein WAL98_04935 [Desulfatiglandaceae bacterium]
MKRRSTKKNGYRRTCSTSRSLFKRDAIGMAYPASQQIIDEKFA